MYLFIKLHCLLFFLFVCIVVYPFAAKADVFKCTDTNGRVIFQDSPCPENQKGNVYFSKSGSGHNSPSKLDLNSVTEEKKSRHTFDLKIGMTAKEVRDLWGRPEDGINTTVSAYGRHEQWVYRFFKGASRESSLPRKYLYFRDGILESYQD